MICCSGDGLIHEALNSKIYLPVGALPGGTSNAYLFNMLKRRSLIVDLLYHMIISKTPPRVDLIIHHFLSVIPLVVKQNSIGITVVIIGEIYSAGMIFGLTQKQSLIYRGFIILTVRLMIWVYVFRCSLLVDAQNVFIYWFVPRFMSICMLCLDFYWLKQILLKCSNL